MDSIRPETSCEAPFPVDRPVRRGLGYFFSLISLVLFALALALPLTGCGGGVSEEEEVSSSKRKKSRKPAKEEEEDDEEEEEEEEEVKPKKR